MGVFSCLDAVPTSGRFTLNDLLPRMDGGMSRWVAAELNSAKSPPSLPRREGP